MHGAEATANARAVTRLNAKQILQDKCSVTILSAIDTRMLKCSQKAVLRNLYRFLADDCSASRNVAARKSS